MMINTVLALLVSMGVIGAGWYQPGNIEVFEDGTYAISPSRVCAYGVTYEERGVVLDWVKVCTEDDGETATIRAYRYFPGQQDFPVEPWYDVTITLPDIVPPSLFNVFSILQFA